MAKASTTAQLCSGSWTIQRPYTDQCFSGQVIGQNPSGNPVGCPLNPTYTPLQTNTFTFTLPVSAFSIDFLGFDGAVNCARIEVRVNGLFYALTPANLSDIPSANCTGSFSAIAVTSDGYITLASTSYSQGRITITGVNASSVTLSSNDGNATLFSSPFGCTILPLYLNFFSGYSVANCRASLRWESGIETNVKNIEVQCSDNNVVWKKVAELMPKGSNSNYIFETKNEKDGFFRLKLNDIDGNYQFSKIIQVKSNCNKSTYSITPNPSTGMINITGLSGNEKILIYDMAGRNVLSFAEPFTNTYNITKLSGGLYVVAILQDKICKAQLKLVKASFN